MDRNGALGLVLPKCNCFVPKTGLHPAKGAACRHSSFLQPTALRASLPTGTFSTYKQLLLFPVFPGRMMIFLHILCGHKHTVYVAGLINKECLLSFPSDHSHRDTRRSQVQSVEAFTEEETGEDICCSKPQLIAIGRAPLSLVMVC